MNKPFELEVDASAFATGAILAQRDERNKPQAVGYFSKAFTEAERNYDIHDRELLAVLRGLEHWRPFLMGSPHEITVFTDHKNLEYYRHPQRINRRVARYIPRLADYHFRLVHKPGALNHADALSRRPDHTNGEEDNMNVTVLTPEVFANTAMSVRIDDRVMAQQLENQDTLEEWAAPFQLVKTGKYWWKDSKLVVVGNNTLRRGVISLFHDPKTAGHPGMTKTLWLVSQDFWWPGMKEDVSAYVQGCAKCQANKNFPGNPKPPSFPIKTEPNALPFETITLDFITKLPESEGYDTILTIVDHDCSKAAFFIPCNETIDAEGVAVLYAKTVLPHYGLPRKVISDRDPHFTTAFTKELCRVLDIEQNISTAYHPQTDGQSERANQWVEQFIRMYIDHLQKKWAGLLPVAQYTHNSWPSATTKKGPYELILGYIPRVHQPRRDINVPGTKERLEEAQEARRAAQAAITHAQSLYKDSPRFRTYSEGDKVWLDARNLKTTHPSFKLAPKRYGPFPITKKISVTTYALKLPAQWRIHPVFHASLLMPYKETPMHGANFTEPPPDLIEGQEEWEIEQILETRKHRNQLQFLIKWKGYSDAHNTWEPEKNLNATELIREYFERNPRSEGAKKWLKAPEVIVRSVTTFPLLYMPSRSSSVEALVERAMERGYYSTSPTPVTPSEGPNNAPSPKPAEPMTIDLTTSSPPISVSSSPSPPPIHPDLPSIRVTNQGLVLRVPIPTTSLAPPGNTRPPTPVIHRSTPDYRAAHAALTRLINDPAMDAFPINYDRQTPPDNDDYPGTPYWQYNPTKTNGLKMKIPDDTDHHNAPVWAKYLRISNDKESLMGTMGKDRPVYGQPLFLILEYGTYVPPALTLEQYKNLHPDSPSRPQIQEVLHNLQNPQITAEI